MPMADGRFAQLPAQQDGAVFNLAGKIEQADIQIFHLHAGGINLGERIFYGLHRFVALALAATQRNDDLLNFQHAVEGNACPMFIGILDDDAIHHAIVRQIFQRPAQVLRRNAEHGGAQAA